MPFIPNHASESKKLAGDSPITWIRKDQLLDYPQAIYAMERLAIDIRTKNAQEQIWLVEHPALITAGTSAKPDDLHPSLHMPLYHTGRGGKYTYHGPGQRVVYVMIDLKKRIHDVRQYVLFLEAWIVQTLSSFGLKGHQRPERVGVWIERPDKGLGYEDKIAAIGVRIKQHVTFHGFAINHSCDLNAFQQFIPCGINNQKYGVTSFQDLGIVIPMQQLDDALKDGFEKLSKKWLLLGDR